MKRSYQLAASLVLLGALAVGFSLTSMRTHARQKKNDGFMYTLPKLPYGYAALEPYIDKQTMEIHHTKHHQKYVDELNAALKDFPEVRKIALEDLLKNLDAVPDKIRTAVRNNGGGHYNHSFFWLIMGPHAGGEPTGKVKVLIDKNFGNFKQFKEQFTAAAKKVFGSGWAWLSLDKDGKAVITSTANQESPLSLGLIPLMCLDVWEHAYYLKYQNKRPDYIDAWWNVVNWDQVQRNLEKAQASLLPPK